MKNILRTIFIAMIMLGLAAPAQTSAQAANEYTFTIQVNQVVTSVSPLMRGSNAPSWLGDQRYADSLFRTRTKYSGLKYLRIPGGSWSNM